MTLLAILTALGADASAQPVSEDRTLGDSAAMQAAMVTYFRGERRGGYAFASVGAASVGAGLGLLLLGDSDLTDGAAYTTLGLGGVQLLVGTIVILQSGPRVRRFTRDIAEQPTRYLAAERRRAGAIGPTIRWLHIAELSLAAGGALAAALAARDDRDTLAGAAAGVSVQALALYVQDIFVARRARAYVHALDSFGGAHQPSSYIGAPTLSLSPSHLTVGYALVF